MPNRPLYFHHVGVVVRDLDASTAWYAKHFGFETLGQFSFPGGRAAFVGRDGVEVEFFQVEGSTPMAPEREIGATNIKIGGINHLAFGVDDIDRAIAELREQGVEIVSPPAEARDGRGNRYAFVRDNERMLVELFQTPS